jgi:hypothetical protein
LFFLLSCLSGRGAAWFLRCEPAQDQVGDPLREPVVDWAAGNEQPIEEWAAQHVERELDVGSEP